MASDVPVYAEAVLIRQMTATAGYFGQILNYVDVQTWRVNLGVVTLIGTLVQALVDAGVMTDEQWQDRLDAAMNGDWPDWMLNEGDPNEVTP